MLFITLTIYKISHFSRVLFVLQFQITRVNILSEYAVHVAAFFPLRSNEYFFMTTRAYANLVVCFLVKKVLLIYAKKNQKQPHPQNITKPILPEVGQCLIVCHNKIFPWTVLFNITLRNLINFLLIIITWLREICDRGPVYQYWSFIRTGSSFI